MATIKKRGSKYAVIYDYRDAQGQRHQKWESFASKTDAEKFRRKVEYKKSCDSLLTPCSQTVAEYLSHFSKRHGLPHINPHAFRHSMASILINSGTDILSISKRLGHANTSTTLNFYGHILQKADAQSAECIANVLLRKNPFPPQEPHDNV